MTAFRLGYLHKMTEIEDLVLYHLDLTEENQNSWHLSRLIDPIYCSDYGTNRTVVQISQPNITLTSQHHLYLPALNKG